MAKKDEHLKHDRRKFAALFCGLHLLFLLSIALVANTSFTQTEQTTDSGLSVSVPDGSRVAPNKTACGPVESETEERLVSSAVCTIDGPEGSFKTILSFQSSVRSASILKIHRPRSPPV